MGFYGKGKATPAGQRGAGHFYSSDGSSDCAPIINLRDEFNALIDGAGGSPGLGQFLLIRKMDRDKTKCACYDETHGSSSDCKYCEGEIYEWTEEYLRGHFTQTFGRSLSAASLLHRLQPQGIFDEDKALIYLKYDSDPRTGDAVYRIRTDIDGSPYYPIEKIEKWRIVNSEDRREEGGAIAFFICLCERLEV